MTIKQFNECSKCKFLKSVYKHPCNKEPFNGSVMQLLGFVCTVDEDHYIFFMLDNGCCELYDKKV